MTNERMSLEEVFHRSDYLPIVGDIGFNRKLKQYERSNGFPVCGSSFDADNKTAARDIYHASFYAILSGATLIVATIGIMKGLESLMK